MKVEVTAQHLRQGHRYDPYNCPVALAIKKAGYSEVAVTRKQLTYRRRSNARSKIATPKRVAQFVTRWDALTEVCDGSASPVFPKSSFKPFSFFLPY